MTANRRKRNKAWAEGEKGYIELHDKKMNPVAVASVDREDLMRCILERKWYYDSTTDKVATTSAGKTEQLGRFILNAPGTGNDNRHIHHFDGNPLNNTKENIGYYTY